MELEKRLDLIGQVGEEIVTHEDLRASLEKKTRPVAYDGFEPSGKIHIAQGLLRAINVNKMTAAGCKFKMLVADWHAWANNKINGDLERIKTVGEYFIETWKQTGMDLKNVEFVWASDLLQEETYWKTTMQVARHTTLNRVLRTTQIMGRSETDGLHASQIFYPCMQAADIFELEADIAQLGMDQRKVNVLARELAEKLGKPKPVAVHHHMLMGLGQPPASGESNAVERAIATKMSKSNPDSAIFMTDSSADIARKINKAYCPEKQVTENPVLEYANYLIFNDPAFKGPLRIERPEKFGGNAEYATFAALATDYASGKLHPADLKKSVAAEIDARVKPVRDHFEKNAKARGLLEQVQSFGVTR